MFNLNTQTKMKKLFLSLFALAVATLSFAQSTLVATLSHGDDIKMFYGTYALRDAHDAAEDGDIINLSGGYFYGPSITKALSIRGVGVKGELPTFIKNKMTINVPSKKNNHLSMEGCYLTDGFETTESLSNATFIKNIIWNAVLNGKTENLQILNCDIYNFRVSNDSCSTSFINSWIDQFINYSQSVTSFINCWVDAYRGGGGREQSYHNAVLYNCIVNCIIFAETCTAYNCLGVGDYGIFRYYNAHNCTDLGVVDWSNIFIDGDTKNDLTDEAKKSYLGYDGTPVGMYGGPFPYNMTPTYPQITKMNVASKTTADGKLSVEIEVSAAQ